LFQKSFVKCLKNKPVAIPIIKHAQAFTSKTPNTDPVLFGANDSITNLRPPPKKAPKEIAKYLANTFITIS
jgi:hypothetical protein